MLLRHSKRFTGPDQRILHFIIFDDNHHCGYIDNPAKGGPSYPI